MAREIVTRIWCDACLHRDPENYTEGTETPPITIGNAKPRIMALCEVDMKEIYEPLKVALAELGQIIPTAGTGVVAPKVAGHGQPTLIPTEGIPCPLGCDAVLQSRDSLNGHLARKHGKTLNEVMIENNIEILYDVAGNPVPNPRPEKVPDVKEAKCDQPGCDKVYTYPKYRRPVHALSIHLSQAHGITKADREAAAAKPAKRVTKA